MKNSSRPSRLHRGSDPPPFDTRVLPALFGNGATYTSYRPDSFDSNAICRPSGENRTLPSSNGVSMIGEADRVSPNVVDQISKFPRKVRRVKTIVFPSGEVSSATSNAGLDSKPVSAPVLRSLRIRCGGTPPL